MAPQFSWLEYLPVTQKVVGSQPIGVAKTQRVFTIFYREITVSNIEKIEISRCKSAVDGMLWEHVAGSSNLSIWATQGVIKSCIRTISSEFCNRKRACTLSEWVNTGWSRPCMSHNFICWISSEAEQRPCKTQVGISEFPSSSTWRSTQCWQRGEFAKLLGRSDTVSGVGTHLLRHMECYLTRR